MRLLLFFLIFMSFIANAQTLKVACVGNSITEGSDLENTQRYPEQLQQLMGDGYEVRNYGLGGRTLLRKGDVSYWQELKYQEVLAWNPDIVVIKLGTNDSKPQNWIYGDEFEHDYKAFIQSFKKLSGSHKIYICTPAPVFEGVAGIEKEVVEGEIVPLVRKIASSERLGLIDLYEDLSGKSNLFSDGVHPNAEGAKTIAEIVFRAIKK